MVDLNPFDEIEDAVVSLCDRIKTGTVVKVETLLMDIMRLLTPISTDTVPQVNLVVDEVRQRAVEARDTLAEGKAVLENTKALTSRVLAGDVIAVRLPSVGEDGLDIEIRLKPKEEIE